MPAIFSQLQSGRLHMIAQCGAKRFVTFADVPTMVESGLKDFVFSSLFSYLGPAGVPQPIVERLNGVLRTALTDPKISRALIESGAQPIGSTPAEHAAVIRSEIAKWKRVAQAAGVKPDRL
jgi:tripartite-type tricarboxylate transporter receptor subunit TctC